MRILWRLVHNMITLQDVLICTLGAAFVLLLGYLVFSMMLRPWGSKIRLHERDRKNRCKRPGIIESIR